MEFLYFLFSKTARGGIAAILFFSAPSLVVDNNTLNLVGTLNGIVMPKVERILKTGTEVKIKYDSSLIAHEKNGDQLVSGHIIHTVKYDPLAAIYHLDINGKKVNVGDIKEAEKKLGEFRIVIPYKTGASRFDVYIEATIDYESSLNIDLAGNVLWDYYIPNKKIRGITIEGTK